MLLIWSMRSAPLPTASPSPTPSLVPAPSAASFIAEMPPPPGQSPEPLQATLPFRRHRRHLPALKASSLGTRNSSTVLFFFFCLLVFFLVFFLIVRSVADRTLKKK